jgi:hypothetical protein
MTNLPLSSILENAQKIIELEKKINKIYEVLNLNLEMTIKTNKELDIFRDDFIDQLLILHKKIEEEKE